MRWVEKLEIRLDSISTIKFLILVIVIQTVIHIKYLNLPPVGFHQWRQTQTLAAARSFYEEDMNILHPRTDNRGNTSGITGMEFPIVNYIIALGYKMFGYNFWVGRVVVLFFSYLVLIACFFFSRKLLKSHWLAIVATIILMFSPLFCYYSIVVLPDIPALAFIFFSLYFFLSYKESERPMDLFLLVISLSLSGLIKAYSFIVLPFVLVEIFKSQKPLVKKLISFSSVGISILIVATWYFYARHLSDLTGNYDYKLNSNFPYEISEALPALKKFFLQWLPELFLNYAQFVLLLFGFWAVIKKMYSFLNDFLIVYLLSFLIYMITFLPMFSVHDYYATPSLPLLIVMSTIGFGYLTSLVSKKSWMRYFVLVLIIIIPVLGSIRALSRLEGAKLPEALLTLEDHVNKIAPDKNSLFIAAGDESPSIYFYFMHRKGWAVNKSLSWQQLKTMRDSGAKYLLSSHRELEENPEIKNKISLVSKYGNFNIFRISDI